MSATVLVVEDEPAIQELLQVSLAGAGYKVLAAMDASQAHAIMEQALPDVIVLDWMLPGMSGMALAKTLRNQSRTHHIPIIMLTARGGEEDKIQGLEAGADDYMTKPFSPRELAARIRAVIRRRAPQLADDNIHAGTLVLNPRAHEVHGNGHPLTLGPAEFRLLRFFMSHPDRVFSRSQLLDHVWGDHVFVEDRTVDVHIRRLRKALSPGNHDRHIQTVRGAGYRFASQP